MSKFMYILTWAARFFIFLFLLIFALKNSASVELKFFFDHSWEAPLVLVLFSFFAGGVFLGVLAVTPSLFKKQWEVARLRDDLARLSKTETPAEKTET